MSINFTFENILKKILITGCCGFIGSHLTRFFLDKSYYVIGIDNLLTGSIENIKNFENNPNFNLICQDICNDIKINEKVEYILHFASPASPIDYIKYPIKTLKIGSRGTENVLNFGLKNNSTVLVASTSEVYGDPLVHPQKESYFGNVNPIGSRGVYDEAKRYLEAITMAYNRKYDLETRIVRIFNTYGPKMRKTDGRAIPNFINQMLENRNITIFGNGTQTRSFTYIDDTIDGIYKLLKSKFSSPVNIGNPEEYSINELVKIIRKLIPSNSKICFKELPENDPKTRRPDISLAKDILNWKPKTGLKKGLVKTIDYFRNKEE